MKDQPDWVCFGCGERYGRNPTPTHAMTCHENECGVCGEIKTVTEARDFGFLYMDWQTHREALEEE